jgi:hypothetical protein
MLFIQHFQWDFLYRLLVELTGFKTLSRQTDAGVVTIQCFHIHHQNDERRDGEAEWGPKRK